MSRRLSGQGSGDTVPAMLTPGEFVINRGAAQMIGPQRLQQLNTVGPFCDCALLVLEFPLGQGQAVPAREPCVGRRRANQATEEREAGHGGASRVRNGSVGKLRDFWVGFGLTIITLGIYHPFWYYFMNDELRDVGLEKNDGNLGQSSPAMSVTALLIGWVVIVPPLLSVYNFCRRIERAQRLGGIPRNEQIDSTGAFLLLFPGSLSSSRRSSITGT